jgi:hypothetical protein
MNWVQMYLIVAYHFDLYLQQSPLTVLALADSKFLW